MVYGIQHNIDEGIMPSMSHVSVHQEPTQSPPSSPPTPRFLRPNTTPAAVPHGYPAAISFDHTKQLLELQRRDYREMMDIMQKMLSSQQNETQDSPVTANAQAVVVPRAAATNSSSAVVALPANLPTASTSTAQLSGWMIVFFSVLIVVGVGLVVVFAMVLKLNKRLKSASWLASILKEVNTSSGMSSSRKRAA
jgi:hypothetical protein